jgi:hypothetical protein
LRLEFAEISLGFPQTPARKGLLGSHEKKLQLNLEFNYKKGLLMFGVYSCIMLVVLINMLIAMMNNSYQAIAVNWIILKIYDIF